MVRNNNIKKRTKKEEKDAVIPGMLVEIENPVAAEEMVIV